MNRVDSAIEEGRKAVDEQLNMTAKMGAWIRLRDAAPDLLAALELAYQDLQREHGADVDPGCSCSICRHILAAINKAKGFFTPVK